MDIDLDNIRNFLSKQTVDRDLLVNQYFYSIKGFNCQVDKDAKTWQESFLCIYLVHHNVPDDEILAMSLEEGLAYAYLLT